jgi:GDPmannose 4,6-dehydratase
MRALITGITGQDGSYLAEALLARGVEVHGLVRRHSTSGGLERLSGILPALTLHEGDLLDSGSLYRAVERAAPTWVFHLAAQSFVGRSWDEPEHTAAVTGVGALRLFEAVRAVAPNARTYHASTSEMYGNQVGRASVEGPFAPRSPYGTAKLFAHATVGMLRASFRQHLVAGILFNHESPRRGPEFVTRKVAMAVARAAAGDRTPLRLGNLAARRDWGWAPDYVEAMIRMLEADQPRDMVLGTGVSHSVEDLCQIAYAHVGLDWRDHVVVDPALVRPADIGALTGDPEPAWEHLGWRPTVTFPELVARMVDAERAALSR